ncbi:hypothetical protein CDV50_02515 [Haematobacter massiliensis]|uniref:Uncharacterized protein n=1 Tax=Haematobacter massiliensis TaxID=195105 RepID=A0A086Y324_9RHOB|nr:hypothetical protein [Haematobacter massiliensis]KFI28674.1 hypothetical protein CN97_18175 [Haematobacter massiliensis]OWJ73523.1 hypothetical protein CDV50_02515 [Haematobacter massiliensis]OWJ88605.1 hypothetical protein CDV51_01085 [Haematobacter massiliensis]QBJ26219.1 hypothetical protein HmaOT1_17945 [Haematobacter massiliensis]
MKILHLFLVFLLAPLAAMASTVPREVARVQAEDMAACQRAGGRAVPKAGYLVATDLNGDGRPDYVTDLAHLSCEGVAGFFCGTAGCPVTVWLSGPGGYFAADAGHAEAWRLEGTTVVRRINGQLCSPPQRRSCEVRRSFTGINRPAPASPVASQSWQLRRTQGLPPVAISPGPGNIFSISAFCLGDQPWLAVVFRERPRETTVRIDFAFAEGVLGGPASRQRGTSDAYVISLAGGALAGQLSGRDGTVGLSVNGVSQGTLPLRGSTSALRGALAGCLKL